MEESHVKICSIDELKIHLTDEVRSFLGLQMGENNMGDLFSAMKRPPASTTCRVNQINGTRQEVKDCLQEIIQSDYPHLTLQQHEQMEDVLQILPNKQVEDMNYTLRVPTTGDISYSSNSIVRKNKAWPDSYRVVICDRFCAEAVLRGSDIFVKGILVAETGIRSGENVAVYADIRHSNDNSLSRGMCLHRYSGQCIYLGLGLTACSRSEMFRANRGVAVVMSKVPSQRVGPCLPPLSGILEEKMMLQNLPSILVGHALNPQKGETILDMCAAPGGKSAHLASLVKNEATIVSCDKSRKKVLNAKKLFTDFGATCITPLCLDATKCVAETKDCPISVKQLLEDAEINENDQLKCIKKFPPESFDRILLDPPCSALGLRPKLFVVQSSVPEIQKHASYQKKFVREAVNLLKPGGVLSYSTCTINAEENECMVNHILRTYPTMHLRSIPIDNMGAPGLSGFGLSDEERQKVRRFDPHNYSQDTMGFFLAIFQKSSIID